MRRRRTRKQQHQSTFAIIALIILAAFALYLLYENSISAGLNNRVLSITPFSQIQYQQYAFSNATIDVGQVSTASAQVSGSTGPYFGGWGWISQEPSNELDNQVAGTITGFDEPQGAAVNPSGTELYVANEGSNTVSVISTATNTVTGIITVGTEPEEIVFSPDGTKAYVTDAGDARVSVINVNTGTVEATITVGNGPSGIAITPNGSTVLVMNEGVGDYGASISVINVSTETVVNTIDLNGDVGSDVAINPAGNIAYASVRDSDTVNVINIATNTVVKSITGFVFPTAIAFSPTGNIAYVADYSGSEVSVVNVSENTTLTTIRTGSAPAAVAFSPVGTLAYVNTASNCEVINVASNTIIAGISTGGGTVGIAVNPSGSTMYIGGGSEINIINNLPYTQIQSLSSGELSLAVNPVSGNTIYLNFGGNRYVESAVQNGIYGTWTFYGFAHDSSTPASQAVLLPGEQLKINPAMTGSMQMSASSAKQSSLETLSASFTGGTSPYTYAYVITNAMTGNTLESYTATNSYSSNSFQFIIPDTNQALGTENVNLIITDSASTPAVLSFSNTITVSLASNSPLSVSISSNYTLPATLIAGDRIRLSALATGGAGSESYVSYNFLVFNSSTGALLAHNLTSSNSISYAIQPTEDGDNLVFNVLVTDTLDATANSPNTKALTVNVPNDFPYVYATANLKIPFNGTEDVTNDLIQAIDGLRKGSIVEFQPNATYLIYNTVTLDGISNITLVGNGAHFVRPLNVSYGYIFVPDDCNNVTFRGMNIHGFYGLPGSKYNLTAHDIGIQINKCNGLYIYNSNFSNMNTYPTDVDGNSWNVVVDNDTANEMGQQGFPMVMGSNYIVENSRVNNIGQDGIDIEGDGGTQHMSNVLITNLTATNVSGYIFSATSAVASNLSGFYTVQDSAGYGSLGFLYNSCAGTAICPDVNVTFKNDVYNWGITHINEGHVDTPVMSINAHSAWLINDNYVVDTTQAPDIRIQTYALNITNLTITGPGLSNITIDALVCNPNQFYITNYAGPKVVYTSSCPLIVHAPTGPSTVAVGSAATINDTGAIFGTPNYTYQWLVKAPGASSYVNATSCSNQKSTKCVFSTTGASSGEYSLELEAKDAAGSVNESSPLQLDLTGGQSTLTIASPTPASQVDESGRTATISDSGASGGASPYTYQWLEKAPGASSYTGATACSAPATTTCSFAISNSITLGTYGFELMATDQSSSSVTSASASVTVNSPLLTSISPSTSVRLDVGQSNTIVLTASGATPPYTYFWVATVVSGSCLAPGGLDTESSYTFSPTNSQAGCTFNFTGTATDSATNPVSTSSTSGDMSVYSTLSANTPTNSISSIYQGQSALLTETETAGASPYTYQWLEKAPGASSYTQISGATSSTYAFATSSSTSTGTYGFEVEVTDSATTPLSSTSSPTEVEVSTAPSSLTLANPSPTTQSITQGQNATITDAGAAGGASPYTYQWLEKAPGASSYTGATACSAPATTTCLFKTSTSSTTGTYNFEIKVTDSAANTLTSNPAEILISVPAPTTTVLPSGGSGSSGGSGGSSGGGGGGGNVEPSVINVSNSTFTARKITNFSADDYEDLRIQNLSFKVTLNYINPTSAGVSINSTPYLLDLGQPVNAMDGLSLELLNVSYLPIKRTVTLEIYKATGVAPNATTVAPSTTTAAYTTEPSTSYTTTVNGSASLQQSIAAPSRYLISLVSLITLAAIALLAAIYTYMREKKRAPKPPQPPKQSISPGAPASAAQPHAPAPKETEPAQQQPSPGESAPPAQPQAPEQQTHEPQPTGQQPTGQQSSEPQAPGDGSEENQDSG